MAARLSTRLAETRGFVAKVWQLARPYWFSEECWFARGSLAAILGMDMFLVYMSKLLNDWYRGFYDALQNKNAEAFWSALFSLDGAQAFFLSFTGLVVIYIGVAVIRLWLNLFLTIRWRRWLTDVYFRDWLAERTYYRMELAHRSTDNPDQRIEQDIASFTTQTLSIGLDLISTFATLVTFIFVLWGLSGSLTIPVLGGIEVPGYMVWVALLYSILGTYLTYFIGRRLVRINFQLERFNADFRFRLVRVRENAESIALYAGEPDEVRRLRGAFASIYDMYWQYITVRLRLIVLTTFYSQVASIFPLVVQAPRYFSGAITLGAVMQTANAFGTVQSSLSWFVTSFSLLADWKATTDRLTTFAETMAETKRLAVEEHGFDVAFVPSQTLRLRSPEVTLPNGAPLLRDLDLEITRGEAIVLQGPSGSGKTTLFRVLAGLWPFGRGKLELPANARVLFLPQKPYLPIGTLREVLSYPETPDHYRDDAYVEALELCRLGHLVQYLERSDNWSMALSPGEQQRLAFARTFLYRPDWLFMDEATSALDEATETHLYEQLKELLPDITLVSIAHKPSVLRFHERRIVLDPTAGTARSEPLLASAG